MTSSIDTLSFIVIAFYNSWIIGRVVLVVVGTNAQLNPIENLFSQIKNYVKDISPATYEELKITIDDIIKNKIKKEHLKNYFKYLFIQAKNYIDTH